MADQKWISASQCFAGREECLLSQEQFLDDPAKADQDRVWPIPTFSNSPGFSEILADREHAFTLEDNKTLLIDTREQEDTISSVM